MSEPGPSRKTESYLQPKGQQTKKEKKKSGRRKGKKQNQDIIQNISELAEHFTVLENPVSGSEQRSENIETVLENLSQVAGSEFTEDEGVSTPKDSEDGSFFWDNIMDTTGAVASAPMETDMQYDGGKNELEILKDQNLPAGQELVKAGKDLLYQKGIQPTLFSDALLSKHVYTEITTLSKAMPMFSYFMNLPNDMVDTDVPIWSEYIVAAAYSYLVDSAGDPIFVNMPPVPNVTPPTSLFPPQQPKVQEPATLVVSYHELITKASGGSVELLEKNPKLGFAYIGAYCMTLMRLLTKEPQTVYDHMTAQGTRKPRFEENFENIYKEPGFKRSPPTVGTLSKIKMYFTNRSNTVKLLIIRAAGIIHDYPGSEKESVLKAFGMIAILNYGMPLLSFFYKAFGDLRRGPLELCADLNWDPISHSLWALSVVFVRYIMKPELVATIGNDWGAPSRSRYWQVARIISPLYMGALSRDLNGDAIVLFFNIYNLRNPNARISTQAYSLPRTLDTFENLQYMAMNIVDKLTDAPPSTTPGRLIRDALEKRKRPRLDDDADMSKYKF